MTLPVNDVQFGWRWATYEEFILAEIGRHAGVALMDDYPPEFFDKTDNVYYQRKPSKYMKVHFKAHFVSRGTFFPKKVLSTNGAFNMNARTLIAPFDTITLVDADLPDKVADSVMYNVRKSRKVFTHAFVRLMARNYGYDIE
jgi:hypothetical protein